MDMDHLYLGMIHSQVLLVGQHVSISDIWSCIGHVNDGDLSSIAPQPKAYRSFQQPP